MAIEVIVPGGPAPIMVEIGGLLGPAGEAGAPGPAPAGTGFVKVLDGVLTDPSPTIPHTEIDGIGTVIRQLSIVNPIINYVWTSTLDSTYTAKPSTIGALTNAIQANLGFGNVVYWNIGTGPGNVPFIDFDSGTLFLDSSSTENEALVINSEEGAGIRVLSNLGTGLFAESSNGTYHAEFGSDPENSVAIERLGGALVWYYGAFTGRLKKAALTASREWALPDAGGSIGVLREFADAAAADAVVSVGDAWWDTTLKKARVRLT